MPPFQWNLEKQCLSGCVYSSKGRPIRQLGGGGGGRYGYFQKKNKLPRYFKKKKTYPDISKKITLPEYQYKKKKNLPRFVKNNVAKIVNHRKKNLFFPRFGLKKKFVFSSIWLEKKIYQ